MTEPLLQTKLTSPALRPDLVPRPQLMQRINQGLRGKLTLLSAPAGFGKTTLVREWLNSLDQPAAWLSLDEDDSDPVCFFTYMVASLQAVSAGLGQDIAASFQSDQTIPLKTAVTRLINEIGAVENQAILILDDFHLVQSKAIHDSLTYLLDHQPDNLHLIITTREDPPVPLPRLRARGQLHEIREVDLRFSSPETARLLNEMMDLHLTPEQVAALERKTEGWVSGLQLAALSLKGRQEVDQFVQDFAGSSRFILDYLMEEVLDQQQPSVRQFLLKTAVLDQFNAALCALMIGGDEGDTAAAQNILEKLERSNLFIIPLDDARQWFRYHHLFTELLRQRLRKEEGDLAYYHRRAADWYAANDYPRRAVHHSIAAADWDQAADLILAQSGHLQKLAENMTFLNWMQQLPQDVIQSHPELCLEYAWALALNGQPEEAQELIHVAEQAFSGRPDMRGKILSARIHIARIRQDMLQTIALSEQALTFLPVQAHEPRAALFLNLGMAYWQSEQIKLAKSAFSQAQETAQKAQNQNIELLSTGFLSLIKAAQGWLFAAEALLQPVLARGSDLPANALPYLVQGSLLLEWNQLEEASTHLQTAVALAQLSGNNELESSTLRQQALLWQAKDQPLQANTALAQARRAAGENAPPFTRARNEAAAAFLALAQGDLASAAQITAQMPQEAGTSLFYTQIFLLPARLNLAFGRKKKALDHLALVYPKAEAVGFQYAQIEILLLQTLAASSTHEALNFLTQALVLAQPGGFKRIFLSKGPDLVPLLHMAAGQSIMSDYCQILLSEFDGSPPVMSQIPPSKTASPAPVETFSEREIEVLQLLAQGLTNQEIAQALFVSINTIKSHLKTIYAKLDAHNRREAVARARLLHLL